MAEKKKDLGCKVLKCTCAHAFQDEEYGPQMRLFNPRKYDGIQAKYRCTVCGAEKGFGMSKSELLEMGGAVHGKAPKGKKGAK